MLEVGHGAPDHFGDALDHIYHARPFGYALVVGDGFEVGVNALARGGIAAGDAEEGDGVGVALGDAAEGVFGAGAGLHSEDANLVAVVNAAKAVRHIDARALLAAKYGADALARAGVYEGLRGEAREPLNALRL